MKEWNNGSMEDLKKSLIDFVRKIKNSDYRKRRLLEDLDYTIHQMYSIPGPVYDRVGGTTNVKPDRIIMLLDKKDRIERALKKIEEEKEIFNSFLSSLTEKQKRSKIPVVRHEQRNHPRRFRCDPAREITAARGYRMISE